VKCLALVIVFQTFVIVVTMIREAIDDFCRYMRDREVNKQKYKKLTRRGVINIESAKIKVGDLIIVEKVCRN
jgi:phospholipid-translocating ATPase